MLPPRCTLWPAASSKRAMMVVVVVLPSLPVTVCDKKERDALGALGDNLEKSGCKLRLGPGYLEGLSCKMIRE